MQGKFKDANQSQTGSSTKNLTVLKQVYCKRTCKVSKHQQAAFGGQRILLFETGLLQEDLQSSLTFTSRLRWTKNLTGLKQVYGTRTCEVAKDLQAGFSEQRILLVRKRFIARELAKLLNILQEGFSGQESYCFERGLYHEKFQCC